MRTLGKLIVGGAFVFIALQAVRPNIPAKPTTAQLPFPREIGQILDKHCYACHSDERRLSWFDEIVPAYWLVRHDVLTARKHLNFSTLGSRPAAARKATLYEAVNMVLLDAMPLPLFVKAHPEARVTPEEMATLKAYLAPWMPAPKTVAPPIAATSGGRVIQRVIGGPPPEFNGLEFDPTFANWKLISTTDRGDNHSFRFILANDIAAAAAWTGNISPWPDGARFAKIAWQQELGPDGLSHPGEFIQVELMVKNAARYRETQGWGWGRWRGLDLQPYGKDAEFVKECTGCHQPMRGDDYVYTLPISTAKVSQREAVNSNAATLPDNLPYQPLSWRAITMYVDPKSHTTATLYGNHQAMQDLKSYAANPATTAASPTYSVSAVLALVTWTQREDPHWFGGRIPDAPQSVEIVEAGSSGQEHVYRRFAGPKLGEDRNASGARADRAKFVLGLAPAKLP